MSIYSAFNIPTILSRPSTTCLQWSADGQLFFLSKTAVYVLTPERGVHSVTLPPGDGQHSHVRWFSTMIDFNPRDAHSWCLASQAWGGLSLGSLDVGLRAVACSPSNLTANASCVAAILSSNMDLSLWHSVQNTVTGEWVKICDVPPLITEAAAPDTRSADAKTLRSQTTCLLWSTQADFDTWPAPCLDSSFLATGTRAGTVNLFRFARSSLEHVATVEVADEWITHLAFSAWKTVKKGESRASLTYGTTSGAVGVVNITQNLYSTSPSLSFCPAYNIETRIEKTQGLVFESIKTGITALACIQPRGHPVIVRTTPGVVSLWNDATSSKLGWSGHRRIRLSTRKLTVASSSFHAVSGLYYVPQEDALLISLSDGTMHVIDSLKTEPTLADVSRGTNEFTSEHVSRVVRSAFKRTDRTAVSKGDVNRVSGFVPFDGSAAALWIQESAQPTNFDYVYDSSHQNMLVAAELRKKSPQNEFLRELFVILNSNKASSGSTPLHLLRPVFLRSQDLLDLQDGVVETLLKDADRCPPVPEIPQWTGDASNANLSYELQRSLKTYLFGCNVLHSLRLKLSVADYCWRHANNTSQRAAFNEAAQRLLQIISAITMRVLCRHLKAITSCLQAADAPFVIRIALQAASPGAPPALRADAARLLSALPPALSSTSTQQAALEEICLACGLTMNIAGGGGCDSVCANGHSWGRCAATTFILSTPKVRTCTGCARKVFMAPSEENEVSSILPPLAQSWVVEAFLKAVTRCMFCGNTFGVVGF
ncbi:transcription factor IIIC subunit delta N-term-domain-containing protein [Mycena amicta]|nr:transcription factor IIIC subunit delta N-term-domain-containing protein [Mycena amicta]